MTGEQEIRRGRLDALEEKLADVDANLAILNAEVASIESCLRILGEALAGELEQAKAIRQVRRELKRVGRARSGHPGPREQAPE